jgi:hypothetical protein
MTPRRLITILLIVMLALSGTTRAFASPRDEDLATTPEEEREARELLEEFNKKFVETSEIAPLIKDYFVTDFAPRLRRHAKTVPFVFVEWKDETAPPDPDDLLRFYVSSTNCLHMLFPLYVAAQRKADKERVEGADEKELKLEEILPPAAMEIVKGDPLLREIWKDVDNDETAQESPESSVAAGRTDESVVDKDQGGDEQKGDGQKGKIDNAEKLRRITLALERLSKIMREHLAAHPVSFEKRAKDAGDDSEEKDDDETLNTGKIEIFKNARVLDKEFYGYPEGTRLVCANVGALHAELVRVDGKLRILTVYLLMED